MKFVLQMIVLGLCLVLTATIVKHAVFGSGPMSLHDYEQMENAPECFDKWPILLTDAHFECLDKARL